MKNIGIIMGSDSDLEIMKEAANVLDEFKVDYEITASFGSIVTLNACSITPNRPKSVD
jgi:hypothetical protein